MKSFDKQMDEWVKEVKARASKQATDPVMTLAVHQQTKIDDFVPYDPEPVEGREVAGALHKIEIPVF